MHPTQVVHLISVVAKGKPLDPAFGAPFEEAITQFGVGVELVLVELAPKPAKIVDIDFQLSDLLGLAVVVPEAVVGL